MQTENKTIIQPVKNGDNIKIIGRRWFDKNAGNTYFSAVGLINGKEVVKIPFEYGYGDHYIDCIYRELIKAGHMPDMVDGEPFWKYCQRNNITKYTTVSDVDRKRDL